MVKKAPKKGTEVKAKKADPARTLEQTALIEKWTKPKLPKFKRDESRKDKIVLDPDTEDYSVWFSMLAEASGVCDQDLTGHLMTQTCLSFSHTDVTDASNLYVAMMHEIAPQDGLESMLAAQMIAVHNTSMELIRRAVLDDQPPEGVDRGVNRSTKLMRTFTAQMEALNRYRGKGQQKVTVEHVNVHEGGQAIVGSVESQGGGKGKTGG